MKIDRIKILGLSGAFLILSVFTMNTALLILALFLFVVCAAYNMKQNVRDEKLFSYSALSKEKKFLWNAVIGIGTFGILMAFIGLFLTL